VNDRTDSLCSLPTIARYTDWPMIVLYTQFVPMLQLICVGCFVSL